MSQVERQRDRTVGYVDRAAASLMSIALADATRGMRRRGESCAKSVMPSVMAIAQATAPRDIIRVLEL